MKRGGESRPNKGNEMEIEVKHYTITAAQREMLRDLAGEMSAGYVSDTVRWAQILQNIIASAVAVEGESF